MTRLAHPPAPGQLGALGPVRITEADLQRNVRDLARRLGWDLVFHAMQPFHSAERGWPDLVLLRRRDRRLIFAELKAEKGKLSERQEEVLDLLRAVQVSPDWFRASPASAKVPHVQVHVWRPSDWDEIEATLR